MEPRRRFSVCEENGAGFCRFPPFSRFYMGVLDLAGMVELMSSCGVFGGKPLNSLKIILLYKIIQ